VLERNPGYSTLCKFSDFMWKWCRIGRKWRRTFCQRFDSFQVHTRYVVRCREEFFQV
jgi:anti-sigma factor ChrR (cupin superfamily)